MSTIRIKSDPKVMLESLSSPARASQVEHILRCLASGERPEDIVADYPQLTLDDIRAAQAFAVTWIES